MSDSRTTQKTKSQTGTQAYQPGMQAPSRSGYESQGICWVWVLQHDLDPQRGPELPNTWYRPRRGSSTHLQHLHEQDGQASREVACSKMDELLRNGNDMERCSSRPQDQSGHTRCDSRVDGTNHRQVQRTARPSSGRTRVHRWNLVSECRSGIRLFRKANRTHCYVGKLRTQSRHAGVAKKNTLHRYQTATARHDH